MVMMMRLRARMVAVVAVCFVAGGLTSAAPVLPAGAAAGAVYVPAGPVRVLNTANGTGGQSGPVGPNSVLRLQVEGVGQVPASGVTAVVLNVTAVEPTAASFVTVYPDGAARPDVSNLNFTAGQTIPNLVTVPVGSDGKVDFYNHAGSVTLTADLAGYYTTMTGGSQYAAAAPARVLNTANGTGGQSGPLGPNSVLRLQVEGVAGVPASGVTAVVLNVTAIEPTAASFVTVYPDGGARPDVSNLNVTAGQTIPNLVIVPVGADGKVDFYNHAGSVTLTADLAGYYDTAGGSLFTAVSPARLLNTANGTGGQMGPVGPNSAIRLQVDGVAGVPASGVSAVVLNVTAVNGTAASFVTVYPDGGARPDVSNLNVTAGQTIPNLVIVPVGADGKVDFYNHAGSVNLTADLAGYFSTVGPAWGDATQVPGLAALDTGRSARVNSMSCPSAGNCTVGGSYLDSALNDQPFVADEVNGTWGNAIEVPGTAALDTGRSATVASLSCPSAGNCAVGGNYLDGSGRSQAFVANEVNGTWSNAIEVPGTAVLNTGNDNGGVLSVSCASAGNCAAGGQYAVSASRGLDNQAFVADEVNGTWGNAIEVPGTAVLNSGNDAEVTSLSCPSAGDCVAGGLYTDSSTNIQAFIVDEANGTWGDAIEVPGSAALNTGGVGGVESVSCPSAGNCVAGGSYAVSVSSSSAPYFRAFVAAEVNGTWGNAIEVPGTTLKANAGAIVMSVSCPSAGNCAAGGELAVANGTSYVLQPFVADDVNGTWGDAIEVPAAAALNTDGYAEVGSVSCSSAGNCVAGGYYRNSGHQLQGFVADEAHGTWDDAIQVPGAPGYSLVTSVSCPVSGTCSAGGQYTPSGPRADRAFVMSQN